VRLLGCFLLGSLVTAAIAVVQDIRRELARPEMLTQPQPSYLVRMVDLTMPPMDKNTTNRRQRFTCTPAE
jgi:hypothetical protein